MTSKYLSISWASGCECPGFSTEHTLLASSCLKCKLCVCSDCMWLFGHCIQTSVTTVSIQWAAHGWTSLYDSEGMNTWLGWKILHCGIFLCFVAKEKEPPAFQTLWSYDSHRWTHTHANMLCTLNVELYPKLNFCDPIDMYRTNLILFLFLNNLACDIFSGKRQDLNSEWVNKCVCVCVCICFWFLVFLDFKSHWLSAWSIFKLTGWFKLCLKTVLAWSIGLVCLLG